MPDAYLVVVLFELFKDLLLCVCHKRASDLLEVELQVDVGPLEGHQVLLNH